MLLLCQLWRWVEVERKEEEGTYALVALAATNAFNM
jgi:hypothetical protein